MRTDATAGRYRVVGTIAQGGMGEVYRARMETVDGLEKDVALKLVRTDRAAEQEFSDLFVEEAKVAMSLSHANVVQSFDVGRVDERWFLAMEYVDGVDLARLLKVCRDELGQHIPHRHVLLICVEALKGLDYAHRRKGSDGQALGIVHRDVSPGNVLISYEGEVKVADFGIAKSTMRSFGSLAGTVKGKLPYMAPEQLRGGAVDRRADLYSMGAVLYELLTGKRLVPLEDGTAAIPFVLEGRWPPPRAVEPAVPQELEHIVLRALALEPADRYPSAAAMRQELEAFALQSSYLLSTADLADFVAEVMSRERVGDAAAESSQPEGAALAVTQMQPSGSDDGSPPSMASDAPIDGAFDAILGKELQKVASDQPFSVFTTRGGRRLSREHVEAAPPASSTDPAHPADPPVDEAVQRGRRRRGARWAAALLALLFGGAAIIVAVDTGPSADAPHPQATGDATRNAQQPSAAAARPAEDGPAPGAARNLGEVPHGLEAPPDATPDAQPSVDARPRTPEPPSTQRPRRRTASKQAGRAASGDVQRERARPSRRAAEREPAVLSANTDPWSYVHIDGQRVGATPLLRHSLPPGRHDLVFRNPSEELERSMRIRLEPGQHRRVTLDLRSP